MPTLYGYAKWQGARVMGRNYDRHSLAQEFALNLISKESPMSPLYDTISIAAVILLIVFILAMIKSCL